MRQIYFFGFCFALVACLLGGVAGYSSDCDQVDQSCGEWGAGQGAYPEYSQYCCVSETSTGAPCGTGVQSVTVEFDDECGHLTSTRDGECLDDDQGNCGGPRAIDGCTSKNCQAQS
jgi:hypothetical protein